jgi:protein associated with RNAse G/E
VDSDEYKTITTEIGFLPILEIEKNEAEKHKNTREPSLTTFGTKRKMNIISEIKKSNLQIMKILRNPPQQLLRRNKK